MAEPVTRIRRAALQTGKLFEISRRVVSIMSALAMRAGFCVTPASQSLTGHSSACNSAHGTTCSISSRNRSRFDFRPYFSNPVCAAKVCCRIRLFTSTYTLYAQPVDRRVLQRFLKIDGVIKNSRREVRIRCILRVHDNARRDIYLFCFRLSSRSRNLCDRVDRGKKIAHARRILNGVEQKQVNVSGIVVKAPVPYNKAWNFHLSSDSITFFEFAVEVCDVSIKYVAEHLDEVGGAFLPAGRWCPWRSRLLSEINHG